MSASLHVEPAGVAQARARLTFSIEGASDHAMTIGSMLLRAVWQPPCLHYTPEFVRFQIAFPASLPSVTVLAYSGDQPVAFVAAMGRDSTLGPIFVSSFYCALPGHAAAATGVIRKEISEMKRAGIPSIVFAASGSTGEAIFWSAEVFGRPHFKLATYHIHMAAARPVPEPFEVVDLAPDAWADAAARLRKQDPHLLSPLFTAAVLDHLSADPHGRRFMAATASGEIAGVAMLSHTHNLQADGPVQILPTLNYVRLQEGRPDALSALVAAAGGPLVTIPNTTGIAPEVLKAARVRATPACFTAVVAGGLDGITGTDLEII